MRLARTIAAVLLTASLAATARAQDWEAGDDPRTHYDVTWYRLDLRLFVEKKEIAGIGVLQAKAVKDGLVTVVVDLHDQLTCDGVHAVPADCGDAPAIPLGGALPFERRKAPEPQPAGQPPPPGPGRGGQVVVTLPAPVARGATFAVALRYHGKPPSADGFTGFHFRKTPDGQPWINTSCQGTGAHTWWPCKASIFHPEDKPAGMDLNISVPGALVAACNGVLRGVEADAHPEGAGRLFRWRHPYPCCTYSIALNVAPYVELKGEARLPGIEKPVPLRYYVLAGDVEKAKKEFAVVPEMLQVFGERFGPFPFPEAKYALVQTSFWGMEHSTIVAYGSSFPSAIPKSADKYGPRNRWFDYILIHESAHEWWGNAVSCRNWADWWIHEGFGTYAEVIWVEHKYGHAKMHEFAKELAAQVDPRPGQQIDRAGFADASKGYNGNIYYKGACVLHQLRWVMGDDAFFRTVKKFNLEFRFKNATTADFQGMCEAACETKLDWFFEPWVKKTALPTLRAEVVADGSGAAVVTSSTSADGTAYRWPIVLVIAGGGTTPERRPAWIEPGDGRIALPDVKPGQVTVEGLDWCVLRAREKKAARK